MKCMFVLLLGIVIVFGSGLVLVVEVDLQVLEQVVCKEGQVNSVGMFDSWVNWKDIWKDFESKYGFKYMDIDMSLVQELVKFKVEKDNVSVDIGDVGVVFGFIVVQQGVSQLYKLSIWEQILVWVKDQDGYWVFVYIGIIVFIVNK